MHFKKIVIAGVGLLGASFAMAAKEQNVVKNIVGFGRSEDNLKRACNKGIIDSYELNPEELCKDADLVLLATPVGAFHDISTAIAPHLQKGTIITDVGSVKGSLVYSLENTFTNETYYVGSHPIAGDDKSGIDAANAKLFKGARCILTPTDNTDRESLTKVGSLWETLGMETKTLTPETHDLIFSSISHLPHVVAFALVNSIEEIDSSFLDLAGRGFIDTTRIAMSSPPLWKDICLYNKKNILAHIDILKNRLESISKFISDSDVESILREFDNAGTLRRRIGENNNEN